MIVLHGISPRPWFMWTISAWSALGTVEERRVNICAQLFSKHDYQDSAGLWCQIIDWIIGKLRLNRASPQVLEFLLRPNRASVLGRIFWQTQRHQGTQQALRIFFEGRTLSGMKRDGVYPYRAWAWAIKFQYHLIIEFAVETFGFSRLQQHATLSTHGQW